MCDFLFVGTNLDLHGVQVLAGTPLVIRDGSSPNVKTLDPSVRTWAIVTNGHCSCGVSPLASGSDDDRIEEERRVRKYEKQGFSRARIERCIAEWKQQRSKSGKPERGEASRLILSLLSKESKVVVYSHPFSGSIRSEPLPVTARRSLSKEFIQANIGYWLESDTVVTVKGTKDGAS